jgi:hypothetical protein
VPKSNADALLTSVVLCAGALGLGTACLDNELDPSERVAGKSVFIAQTRDFAPYTDWMSFKRESKSEHGGLLGTTTIYVNNPPDPETQTFPVGTILFKRMDVVGFDQPTIHAMTKRGGGFNAQGALGWEYFELLLDSKSRPIVLWRGEEPPSDEQYQALLGASDIERPVGTDGTCNSCHSEGQDGVLDEEVLSLLNGT